MSDRTTKSDSTSRPLLREALEKWDAAMVDAPLPPEPWATLADAARRFLALTETGPDYEAACWALVDSHAVEAITEIGGLTLGDVILAVDAALADYLTEEET